MSFVHSYTPALTPGIDLFVRFLMSLNVHRSRRANYWIVPPRKDVGCIYTRCDSSMKYVIHFFNEKSELYDLFERGEKK